MAHLLRDLPHEPPLKPAADALSKLRISAGLAVEGAPLVGAAGAAAPAAAVAAGLEGMVARRSDAAAGLGSRQLLLSVSFSCGSRTLRSAQQRQQQLAATAAGDHAAPVAAAEETASAAVPIDAAASSEASSAPLALQAAAEGAVAKAPAGPIMQPVEHMALKAGHSSSTARPKPAALVDLHAYCHTTSPAAGTQQHCDQLQPECVSPTPPPTPPLQQQQEQQEVPEAQQKQQALRSSIRRHQAPAKEVSFRQADGSIVFPQTGRRSKLGQAAAAAAPAPDMPASSQLSAARAARQASAEPCSGRPRVARLSSTSSNSKATQACSQVQARTSGTAASSSGFHTSPPPSTLQQLLDALQLSLLSLRQQLGIAPASLPPNKPHSTLPNTSTASAGAAAASTSVQQPAEPAPPPPLFGQGDHLEHQVQPGGLADRCALAARAVFLVLAFLPFLTLGVALLLLALQCTWLAARRRRWLVGHAAAPALGGAGAGQVVRQAAVEEYHGARAGSAVGPAVADRQEEAWRDVACGLRRAAWMLLLFGCR